MRARHAICAGLALAIVSTSQAVAEEPCRAEPVVKSQTTLIELADRWFGDPGFRWSILLATNARSSDPKFGFIGNPNQLAPATASQPNHVCIPMLAEAERLQRRYDTYIHAVTDMAVAEPSEVVTTLDPVPASGPVQVATWVRTDQLSGLPSAAGASYTTTGDVWVTLSPKLQDFCQDFVANHSDDPAALTLRLEQRLGLAPASSKTFFVTYELASPTDGISLFRPCGDTEVTDTTCTLGPPASCPTGDSTCAARSDFFYQQYYGSYGSERPVEFPWTSLGYTFDWAPGPAGLGGQIGFVAQGESEYVIPAGTEVTYVGRATTGDYCAPPG
ncbi:MAG: hypothetical protein AAFR17_07180 [Pseudomonadota bacterium]